MSEDVKLLVAVASGRGWCARFGESLAQLAFHLGNTRLGGRLKEINFRVDKQAYLVVARNEHLCQAIDEGYTHLLSLDDDMTFPPDVVDRMLAHDKPVLTCNYRKKNPQEVIGTVGDFSGKEINSEGKTGLEQVYSMGMGMVLMKTSELLHVPRPYFAVLWDNKAGKYAIEDAVFSLVLHENKVPIYCDHDLSKDIGHVGEVEYRFSKE